MAVLQEEILKSVCGTEEKAIQPTWLLTVASVGSISVKAAENEGGDDPTNSPSMSLSPAIHTSCTPTPCVSPPTTLLVACSLVPHSPSKSPSKSPSPNCSSSSGSSSGSGSASGSASGSGSSSSSGSGSGNESSTGSPEKSQAPAEGSGSGGLEWFSLRIPEVVLVQEDDENGAGDEEEEGSLDDEEMLSQGTVSLLNISNSDNEEPRKAAVHKKACKSDILYAAW